MGEALSEPWPSSGYSLLEVDQDGWLVPGAPYLRHLLLLPELAPISESCSAELALHERLMDDPMGPVEERFVNALADSDARENYRYFLAFREILDKARTIEGAYLRIVDPGSDIALPPYFARLLAQLSVRRVLDGFDDAMAWRVAETFFRTQKASVESGVLLADAELLERRREPGGLSTLQLLIREAEGAPPQPADGLEVLRADSGDQYWVRGEHHDLALDLTPGREASAALCRLLEAWLYHFHRLGSAIEPVKSIKGDWRWHIGMDMASNAILNELYAGGSVEDSVRAQIIGLFQLTLEESHQLVAQMRGMPVYLAIAMDENQRVELKPQNLLVNLPLMEPD